MFKILIIGLLFIVVIISAVIIYKQKQKLKLLQKKKKSSVLKKIINSSIGCLILGSLGAGADVSLGGQGIIGGPSGCAIGMGINAIRR